MNPVTAEIFSQLLEKVKDEYSKNKKLTDGSLSTLSFLFESTALQALELIDHQCINLIKSPSGRELYQIQRVIKKEQYMCKHKLAAVLCSAMGLCKELQYSDETVSLMLSGER